MNTDVFFSVVFFFFFYEGNLNDTILCVFVRGFFIDPRDLIALPTVISNDDSASTLFVDSFERRALFNPDASWKAENIFFFFFLNRRGV